MSRTGVTSRTALVIVLVLAVVLSLSGCVEVQPEDVPDWVPDWLIPEAQVVETGAPDPAGDAAEPGGWEDGLDPHGRQMPYGSHGHGTEVLLLGRSVMMGLFDHWEWGGENGVVKSGFAFYYGELSSPPDIADDAVRYVDNAPPDTVVLFKLCFVDFWARQPGDVEANLEENLGYVRRVVDAALARDIPLVLTTALPETQANTTPALLDLHRRYNDAVGAIAQDHATVYLFDLHDVLADQQGALYKGLAVSPSDAHLNDVAYFELEEELLDFLAQEFGTE
jgi:hypothetical protein